MVAAANRCIRSRAMTMTADAPGALSKLLTYSLVPLPQWARVRIMGRVMSGMTKKERTNALGTP